MSVENSDWRLVNLEGAVNFRDLGGYKTQTGMVVRRRMIYRSGAFTGITDADRHRLSGLGIKLVCDFRSNAERRRRPSDWPGADGAAVWARDHASSAGDLWQELRRAAATAESMRELMITAYAGLAYEQAASYQVLFARIAAGELPLVFHCAAGKDRTGIAAALLLTLLGVDRETVAADYLLTGQFSERLMQLVEAGRMDDAPRYDRAVLKPLLAVERRYLDEMFTAIERSHGSAALFMRDVLHVDEGMAAAIRGRLLESYQL